MNENILKNWKKGYVGHKLNDKAKGIVVYDREGEDIEVYSFYCINDVIALDETSLFIKLKNSFDVKPEMLEDWWLQSIFEDDNNNTTDVPLVNTVSCSLDEFRKNRPHFCYRDFTFPDVVDKLKTDDETEKCRCNNCGYPYFYSLNTNHYKGVYGGAVYESLLEKPEEEYKSIIRCSFCDRIIEELPIAIDINN